MSHNSIPDRNRVNSYSGGYMDVGKEAEEIVMGWLKKQPWVIGLDDLRNDRAMQKADADCLLSTDGGQTLLAEIKSDKHLGVSPNVLFEILRINHTAQPDYCVTLGWSARSAANLLFFYASELNRIYQCTMFDYRKKFQKYTEDKRDKTNVIIINTDRIKTTLGVLIPYDFYKDIFKVYYL